MLDESGRSISCFDNGFAYEVFDQVPCPTAKALADLWFPLGAPPAPGRYKVHPAASDGDLAPVPDQEVAMLFSRSMNERWFAQSGFVDVEIVGDKRYIRFQDIFAFLASNHSKTTTIEGQLICFDVADAAP